jgi:hypothetical protein
MSQHKNESAYTPQEREENSRVDALAMFSIVIVAIGLLVFYVAT